MPVVHSGLFIGEDPRDGRPVAVNVLRELPTRIGVLGAGPVAGTIAMRALALGARLTVHTRNPAGWRELPGAVINQAPRPGSALAPSVVVEDPPERDREPGPWETILRIYPRLVVEPSLDLLVTGRLSRPDADALVAWRGLPAAAAGWLTGLPADVVALVAAGRLRLARPMVNGVAR